MINKQSLWFLTLFSLILVLSVYYITMPNELLITNNGTDKTNDTSVSNEQEDSSVNVSIQQSEVLVTMRVELDEEREKMMSELEETLTSDTATALEKNDAFEQMKVLNEVKAQEKNLEDQIKNTFSLDSFVKIDGNNIKVVVIKKDHDSSLANQIMKKIQENFQEKKAITIKFEQ